MEPFRFNWRRDRHGYDIKEGLDGAFHICRRGNATSDMRSVDLNVTAPVHRLFAGTESPGRRGDPSYPGHPYNVAYDENLDGDQYGWGVAEPDDEPSPPSDLGGVLRFTNYFGLLGDATGNDATASMSLDYFMDQRMRVQAMLAYGRFHVLENFRVRAPELIGRRAPNLMDTQAAAFNENVTPHMSVRLNKEKPGVHSIQIIPRSLISYVWLSLARQISEGMEDRRCANIRCPTVKTVKATATWQTCGPACRQHVKRYPEDDRRKPPQKRRNS